MSHRSDREPGALIDRAEGAAVPGTVPGHPQQKAVRLAGGADGALLKALVGHVPAVGPLWHSLTPWWRFIILTIISSSTQQKMKNSWCRWGGRPWPPVAGGHGGPPHRG